MLRLFPVVFLALALPAAAQDPVPPPLKLPCVVESCAPSSRQVRDARSAYERGERLSRQGRSADAFEQFDRAARLNPGQAGYLMARELTRQHLVFEHLQRGDQFIQQEEPALAAAAFRQALELDPGNDFALARLHQAAEPLVTLPSRRLRVLATTADLRVQPQPGRQSFRFRGDSRELLQQVAAAYGVTAMFDDSVAQRRVRFDVDDVDFETAMRLASSVTRTFWVALGSNQLLVVADNAENRRHFEPMSLRTFYFPDAATAQELTEMVNALRTLFEIRLVTAQPATNTIVVRAPTRTVEAVTRFFDGFDAARAQVMLDVQIFEVSRSLLRNLGLDLPLQFRMFNISAEALQLVQIPNLQELIDQLIASGAINQANTAALGALLQQMLEQQSSIFREPFATFGGGSTLMGLTIPASGVRLSRDETRMQRLQHVTMRASHGDAATLRLGARFPILNASFAPIFGSPALSQVLGTGSFVPPFPSFTYEDLGVTVKATPQIRGDREVQLLMELSVTALSGVAFNAVPVISNREYNGTITVRNGQTAVVLGSVSHSEQRSLRGLPGLGRVAGVGRLVSTETKEEQENQLLILVTPYVLSVPQPTPSDIWLN